MILSGRLFFWLLQCILLLPTNADDGQHIRGVPGIDYPDYQTIPHTSFRCSQQQHIPGLYADPETGCQMFHHCYEHRHESFLCPPGTIFNQAILVCDYWYSADCSAATSHYKVESQHKVDPKIDLVPIKNPSRNIFNKLATLYEVKEPLSIDSDYAFKESNFFSDEDDTDKHTFATGNYQEYDNNILKVSSIHDRREGVITETYNGHSYSQYENKNGKFEDFESSGEPEDSEEHSGEEFFTLNDTEKSVNFDKQYFAYGEFKDFKHDAKYHLNNEEHLSNFSDIVDGEESSSKYLKSGGPFVKRQSKAIESRNERKHRRRKSMYTIMEPEANIKEITTTEMPKDINLKKPTDSPTYSQESVTTSNSISTPSASKTKRRKPVLIELEDYLQYNVDNTRYGNPQSNIPEFSMDAEKISVKLFPSGNKRKPVDRLMQHQVIDTNDNTELRTLNNIASHESNIYHTSTLSAIDDIESFEDISMNLEQVYPKRKKNTIRIIDYEDNHDIHIENEQLKDATTFTPVFEEDFTTQSASTNFEDFDKFADPHFHDVEKSHEIAYGNSELVRQLEDNHDVYVQTYEVKDRSTFTSIFEDEFTTQSASTNFEDFDKFTEANFHDRDLENAGEFEGGHSKLVAHVGNNHDVYIENEEMKDASTFTSIIEDDFTTQSASTNLEDFDRKFYPNFDYRDVEIAHEIENGHSDLVSEQYEDTYNFITPYPHIEMFDGSEDTHFIQMNPDATLNVEDYEDKKYLEYINDFSKYKSFEYFKIKDQKEDYSFVTTEFSIPEISTPMSSKISHSEGETNRFYFNPNNIIESTFDDSNTSESLSNLVSETLDENDGVTNVLKPLPNYTYETVNDIKLFHNKEIKRNNITSETKVLSANTSQNITNAESAHARIDAEVFTLIDAEVNEYLINKYMKDNLNVDLLKNIRTETSVYVEENNSSKDSFEEQYDSYDTLYDVNSMETNDFNQRENESTIENVQHKLEFDENKHQSDEPMDSGILEKMELESVENKSDEIHETSNFDDSEIDFDDLTNILDEFEHDQNLSQNNQSIQLEYVVNPIQGSKGQAEIVDTSKTLPAINANVLHKEYSNLPQKNPGSIKPNMVDKPMRIPRMFMPPYTRDFNFEKFNKNFNLERLSSQNFASVPYLMLQLKQKSMNKLLGSSMDNYGLKGIEDYYSTQTGDLLQSPKIAKLISIGKNLLSAKKAKLRIFRRYVNY